MSDEAPIFQSIFAESWVQLPPVFHKHYANRPYSLDKTTAIGTLDVMCKPPLLWLAPIIKLLGQIPAVNESNVPVSVEFQSDKHSRHFQLNRQFNFANSKPYLFQSRMYQLHGDEVIERMCFGLVWRMRYAWHDNKVTLTHRGYALQLFGKLIPIPLTFILGKAYAEEWAIDEHHFGMQTHITHPLWGKIYEYKGQFEVIH